MKNFMEVFAFNGLMPAGILKEIERNAKQSVYAKGDLIPAIGQPLDELVLIERGMAMSCMYTDGPKQVRWIKKETEFILLLERLLSEEYIRILEVEALEDTVIWSWSDRVIKKLCRRSMEFNIYFGGIILRDIERMDEHRENGREGDMAEYYAFLQRNEAALLSRVPHKALASFMSISEGELWDIQHGARG